MLEQISNSVTFFFVYIDSSTSLGKTGLTPTGKARRITDGTEFVLSITELDSTDFPGVYTATLAGANTGAESEYLGHATTTSTSVVQRDVYALWCVGRNGSEHIDADVSSRVASSSLPANFALFAIDGDGKVTVSGDVGITQQAADKVWSSTSRTITQDLGVDTDEVASKVWTWNVRTLTGGVIAATSVEDEEIGGEQLSLIQRSSRLYTLTIPDIPVGRTVVKSYFMVKNLDTDTDEDALLTKIITTSTGSDGKITADGSTGQTAVLEFTIDNDDLDALPLRKLMHSSVKIVLDNGAVYAVPGAFRPVVIYPPGVQAVA